MCVGLQGTACPRGRSQDLGAEPGVRGRRHDEETKKSFYFEETEPLTPEVYIFYIFLVIVEDSGSCV